MSQQTSTKKPSVRQLLALAAYIVGVIEEIFSFDQIQYWIKNKGKLREKLLETFSVKDLLPDVRIEWQNFYKEHFGLDVDFTNVIIPEKPEEGSWRAIFIPAGLAMNRTLEVMRSKFKTWTYATSDNLDKAIPTNTRTSQNAYAIWVRDGVEPDQKYLGKSTREADPNAKIGMTVLERMVFEVKFFVETGQHLDIKGLTFCTGSRYSDGDVSSVRWDSDDQEVRVGWCRLDYSFSKYGLREAVS